MMNKLKAEMEKEFDKKKNYNRILEKIEGVRTMRNWKFILVPVCMILIIIAAFVINKTQTPKKFLLADRGQTIEVEWNVNKLKELAQTSSDADIEIMKIENIPEKFTFLKRLKIPNGLELEEAYAIYTRSNREIKEYNLLHDYVFQYKTEDGEGKIILAFSEVEKPIRDYYINETEKKSQIGEIEFEVSQYKEMYILSFKYQNICFDIETNQIEEGELLELLKSIVIE